MQVDLDLISTSEEAYRRLMLEEIPAARKSVLIATALARETRVEQGDEVVSFLDVVNGLLERGVSVHLLFAGVPSRGFMASMREMRHLPNLDWRICARWHAKAFLIDGSRLYLGSANLTPAAVGHRRAEKKNFEFGIWTEDPRIIQRVSDVLWSIWQQEPCGSCRVRRLCFQEHREMGTALNLTQVDTG